jgi:osmotically-inducible protein OsmY
MRPDADIRKDIAEQLFLELRIDDQEIAPFVQNGVVTLRGTVGSLGAKMAAAHAAHRVEGVRELRNDLAVRLMTRGRHDDADLRGSLLTALSVNTRVPPTVDARVENGIVTLTGTVDDRSQRDEAEVTVRDVRGVVEIHNQIAVENPELTTDVSRRVREAFERNALVDAVQVSVEAVQGTVTLSGTVRTWSEHDAAVDAAWAAAGVTRVVDRLVIGA